MTARCRLCAGELRGGARLTIEPAPSGAQHFETTAVAAAGRRIALAIVTCPACGLVQSASDPPEGYRRAITAAGVSGDMRAHRLAQAQALARIAPRGAGRIALVGCGSGYELEILAAAGWRPEGIESGGGAVAGFTVHDGYPEAGAPLPGAPYDAVACFNFLEHAPDPVGFLRALAAGLSADGVGVVEVPNYERQRAADYVADHVSYFTRQTLQAVLVLGGFDVMSIAEVRGGENVEAIVRRRAEPALDADAATLAAIRATLAAFFTKWRTAGRPAVAWGASHQALTLLASLPDGARPSAIVDSAPFKQGRFAPVTGLPIVAPSVGALAGAGAVVVIASGYEKEIVATLRDSLRFGGEVWAPRERELVRLA